MDALVTQPIPALLERIASTDPDERRRACLAAVENPSATFLVDALGEALGDPEKAVARAASDALVEIAARMGGVEKAIRSALRSELPRRRWGAAFTAARIEPPGPRLLPPVVEALSSADGDVRWAAARVVVEIGRSHGEVLPLLLAMVRSGERAIQRRMATFALRELAPDSVEAAEVLLGATRDIDLQVRRAAFTATASLTTPPPGLARRLLEAVHEDDDAASRRLAALSLGEISRANPQAISPEAIRQLRDEEQRCQDPDLRRAIQRALGRVSENPDRRLEPSRQ
jgi:HEAT repeat protein